MSDLENTADLEVMNLEVINLAVADLASDNS